MKKKILSAMTALVTLITCAGLSVPAAYAAETAETAEVSGFSYDSTNFKELDLTGKTGFSLNTDGTLKMEMQAEKTKGSQLSLGGKGVEGEKVRFKIVYTSTSVANNTAQYSEKNAFVYGGDFFQLLKLGKNEGRVRTINDATFNDMFTSDYQGTKFYYTVIVDMNTKTGAAEYGVWQKTSVDDAKNVTDFDETIRRKLYGETTARNTFTAGNALSDFTLSTQPSVAGSETEITVYSVSLEKLKLPVTEFEYNKTNFKELELDDTKGFSLDNDGNLKMTMQAKTTDGGQLTLGGAGVEGENVRFKIVYRDTTGAGDAQFYKGSANRSFVNGGGFFNIYKQGGYSGSLQMDTRVVSNQQMFVNGRNNTDFYYAVVVDMNTATNAAKYAVWQCNSLEDAMAKGDIRDASSVLNWTANGVRVNAQGTASALTGRAAGALGDFVLSTQPIESKDTTTDIIVYSISLEDIGVVDCGQPVITTDDGVGATISIRNTTKSDRDYAIILAAYGTNDELIDVVLAAKKVSASTETAVSESVSFETAPTGAVEYRAYVWDMKTLEPLSAAGTTNTGATEAGE